MPAALPFQDPLFELHIYEDDLPKSARPVAKSALNRFHLWLAGRGKDVSTASKLDVMKYMQALDEAVSKPTALSNLCVLRRFYAWALAQEYVDVDPTKGIKRKNTSGANAAHQPVTSEQEYAAMMRHCPKGKIGARDKAVLSLIWHSGLRRSEICKPDISQWRDDPQRPALIVGDADDTTKNGGSRVVPLNAETARLLRLYIYRYRKGAAGTEPLFQSANAKGGRLTPNGAGQIIERARERAGLPVKGVHSFRRAWTINGIKAGMSSRSLQKLGGWSDDKMVARYAASQETELALDEYYAKMGTAQKAYKPRLRAVS